MGKCGSTTSGDLFQTSIANASSLAADANGVLITGSGGGISTIAGDTGTATGATVTFNANSNAGASWKFTASGATVDLVNTDANSNIFIGSSAGNSTLSGIIGNNLGIGASAGNALTTGTGNAFIGGSVASLATSSSNNVGLGYLSLSSLTTGLRNTALGENSLSNLSTGSTNISIGRSSANNYASSESSNIIIGNIGTASESNVIRIGTQGSGDGQQNKCFISGIAGVTVSNSATVLIDTTTGQLGTVASSIRYKENIVPLKQQTISVLDLEPVQFNYKSLKNEIQYGFIAEDVEKIHSSLVSYNAEGQPETVKYHLLTALLLNEIQKLNKRIQFLESKHIR